MDTSKKRFTDYFDLLDVDRDATKEQVQKAFMKKASVWHPDKADNDDQREYFTKVYQDLQVAYKILSSDKSRKQYMDAQQTTDLEFKSAPRDVAYSETSQFKDDQGKFDHYAFHKAFDQTREQRELEILQQMQQRIPEDVVKEDDFKTLLARREEELNKIGSETAQIFTGTGKDFDNDTFNRAFDFMKTREPGKGVQLYEGDPMAMFSGGGLEECDPMSAMHFRGGTDFTGQNMDNLVLGQSVNPNRDFDLKQLQTGEKYGMDTKLTEAEIQAKMASIQADRDNLASMDKNKFIVEPSEIEKLYSDLFQPMDIEGLEAPIKIQHQHQPLHHQPAHQKEGENIRKRIEQKKKQVSVKIEKN